MVESFSSGSSLSSEGEMRSTDSTVLLVACVVGLSACADSSPLSGIQELWEKTPTRVAELRPVANRIALTPLWNYSVGSQYRDPDSHIAPWIDRDQVLLASNEGAVVALAAETGARIWEASVPGTVLAGVAADERAAYVGTWEQEIFALDRASGAELWKKTMSSEVLSLKALPGGRLAVRTNDGRMSVLDAEDGETLWNHVHGSPSLTLRGAGEPEAQDDRVLAGFDDGQLIAFDAESGLQHWKARLAIPTGRTELERIVDVDGPVRLEGGVAYAAALSNQVGAVETVEGDLLWSKDIKALHAPAVDDVAVYVTDLSSSVWALDRKSGGAYWEQDALAYRNLSAPAPTGLHVIVVDFDGYLHWLRITDGEIVARHKVDGPLQAPPQARAGRIYLLHRGGRFAAYQFVPLLGADAGDS